MSERLVTFDELVRGGAMTLGDGYRTKKAEHGKPGIPILRVAEVRDGAIRPEFVDYVSEAYRSTMGYKVSKPGDVILTTKGTVGRVAIVPASSPEFVYSPQVCFFRIFAEAELDRRYLYYWFKSNGFWSQAASRKSQTDMADYLNLADIRSMAIDLPSVKTQRAIATVLGALDDKIAVNERITVTAELLGGAYFEEYFSDALQHVTGGTTLPAGWMVVTLGEAADVIETGTRPKGGVASYAKGVPSIGAESIVRLAQFDFSKVKYVPENFFTSMRSGIVQDRDILVYKDGGKPGEFKPHVSMFGDKFPFDRMCINEHVYRVRMKPELGQEFGYYWLSSEPVMNEMRTRGTGAAIPGINSTAVKGIPVVKPPADRVAKFDAAVLPLISKVFQTSGEILALADLRDTLLPQLMSGKLRVRDAERIVEDIV